MTSISFCSCKFNCNPCILSVVMNSYGEYFIVRYRHWSREPHFAFFFFGCSPPFSAKPESPTSQFFSTIPKFNLTIIISI